MSAEKKFVFISLFFIYSMVLRELLLSKTRNVIFKEFENSDDDILQETVQKYSELSHISKEELVDRLKIQVSKLNQAFQQICLAFSSQRFNQVPGCRLLKPCELAENFDKVACSKIEHESLEEMFNYGFELIQTLFDFRIVDGSNYDPYIYVAKILATKRDFDLKGFVDIKGIMKTKKTLFEALDTLESKDEFAKLIVGITVEYFAFASYNKRCLESIKSYDPYAIGGFCIYLADGLNDIKIRINYPKEENLSDTNSSDLAQKSKKDYHCEFGPKFLKNIHLAVIELSIIATLAKSRFLESILESMAETSTYLSFGQFIIILMFVIFPKIPFILQISNVIIPKILWNYIFGCGCKLKNIKSAWQLYPNVRSRSNDNKIVDKTSKNNRRKRRRIQL